MTRSIRQFDRAVWVAAALLTLLTSCASNSEQKEAPSPAVVSRHDDRLPTQPNQWDGQERFCRVLQAFVVGAPSLEAQRRLVLLKRLQTHAPAQWRYLIHQNLDAMLEGHDPDGSLADDFVRFTAFAEETCGINLPAPPG